MVLWILIATVFLPCLNIAAASSVYDTLQGQSPATEENNDIMDQQITEETETTDNEPSNTWLFFTALARLVGATVFIILIIYYGAKLIMLNRKKLQSSQYMQTIGVHPLGQNKNIQLIRVGKKVYIVGVADDITLLKEMEVEDAQQLILQEDEDVNSDGSNKFEGILKNKISEYKNRRNNLEQETTTYDRDGGQ